MYNIYEGKSTSKRFNSKINRFIKSLNYINSMIFSTENLINVLDRYKTMILSKQLTKQQQEILWNRILNHEPYDRDFYAKYLIGDMIYNENQKNL